MKLNKDNLLVCEVCENDTVIFSETHGIVCESCYSKDQLEKLEQRSLLTREDLTPF